ncbi:MAG: RHS repeat-associated core domain-containing protein [Cyclobacteriaceae bacterium]
MKQMGLFYPKSSVTTLPSQARYQLGRRRDDMEVTLKESPVVQQTDYYPFGLQHNTSWTRASDLKNDMLYNAGSELNGQTKNYETFLRQYDPALGRFTAIDPLASSFAGVTPYNYAFNDPIALNDPNGDCPHCGFVTIETMEEQHSNFGYQDNGNHGNGGFDSNRIGPGSGNHWSDQYRSVAGNLALMSTNAFREFYGLYNDNGSFNYNRAGQLARSGGLGTTFSGSFGIIDLSTGSTDIKIVSSADNYFYRLDGKFYGVGGGGDKGYAIQNPYTLQYEGFNYKTDGPSYLRDFNTAAGVLGVIGTPAICKRQ